MRFLNDTMSANLNDLDRGGSTQITHETWLIAAYFFDFQRSDLARSVCGMLRSVLWQIIKKHSGFCDPILRTFTDMKQNRVSISWDEDTLVSVLRNILEQDSHIRVILLIDALDEHNGPNVTVAKAIGNIYQAAAKHRRICVASHPYPEFKFRFKHQKALSLDAKTSDDIWKFVDSQLDQLLPQQEPHQEDFKELKNQILEKANGSFLWIGLTTGSLARALLQRKPITSLRKVFMALPEKLEDVYQRILDQLGEEDREDAEQMLLIVHCLIRPFSVSSLCRVLEYFRLSPVCYGDAFEDSDTSIEVVGWLLGTGADPNANRNEAGHLTFTGVSRVIIRAAASFDERGDCEEASKIMRLLALLMYYGGKLDIYGRSIIRMPSDFNERVRELENMSTEELMDFSRDTKALHRLWHGDSTPISQHPSENFRHTPRCKERALVLSCWF